MDNHAWLDPDDDSLINAEEYRTCSWGSDPYRKDLYLEMDIMAEGPLGQNRSISSHAKELIRTAYHQRNVVFHLDDGCMGGGGEIIPFDRKTYPNELRTLYKRYFLQNDSDNWRRSVFRYAMIIYQHHIASGVAYVGEYPRLYWHARGTNTFVVSSHTMKKISLKLLKRIENVHARILMHELGHTFGIDFLFPLGCDNSRTYRPRNLGFWLFAGYKSCTNYRYVYSILDYSDGSHGLLDYDDWSHLDFSFFEQPTS